MDARLLELAEKVPKGLTVIVESDDHAAVHYRRTGMGCMNLFLVVWLSGWTVACFFMIREYMRGRNLVDSNGPPLTAVFLFVGFELVVLLILLRILFERRSLYFTSDFVIVVLENMGVRRVHRIEKSAITGLEQVQDGGTGEDGFPGWGLELHADRTLKLFGRQPYEKSAWLGAYIAQWSQSNFVALPEPKWKSKTW